MDAHGIVFQHLLHEGFLANVTHVVAHEVGGLPTFFHFVGNHVAPVASGKSHDKREVAFTIAGEADGEVLLYLQGHIVGVVSGGLAVLAGVDAE